MANWGQGAVNNTIGWGQGALNNTINWGKSYFSSFSGDTSVIGSLVPTIINDFKIRVASDGGVFEAESCLTDILNELNNI